jgi:ComF family protein
VTPVQVPALARELLELFLPRACLGCRDRVPPEDGDGLVCARCRTMLRRPPPPRCSRCDLPLGTGAPPGEACLECLDWPPLLVSARGAVVMEPPADALVHALKYGGWRSLGELMGSRMAAIALPLRGRAVAVPVPTTEQRRRERGYNQATILAQVVARLKEVPLVEALERPGGRTQVRLGPQERRRNVRGSFRARPDLGSRIEGRDVILIDDVLTTGATALAAVEALTEGGAGSVHLLTFARALPFASDRGRPTSG